MILSICFNPCKMDYRAWLTVSGLIMTSLVFTFTRIDQKTKENVEKFEKAIKLDRAYTLVRGYKQIEIRCNFLRSLSFALFVSTIIGIISFIINLEQLGAVIIFLVLVSVVFLFGYWHYQLVPPETIMTPSDIESIKTIIKTDFHYDPQATDQPNGPESN